MIKNQRFSQQALVEPFEQIKLNYGGRTNLYLFSFFKVIFFLNIFFLVYLYIFDVTNLTPTNAKHDKLPHIKEGKNCFCVLRREREKNMERK